MLYWLVWKHSYGRVKQIQSYTQGINWDNLFQKQNLNIYQKFLYAFLGHAKDIHGNQRYHQYYISNKKRNNCPKLSNDLYINLFCTHMMGYYIWPLDLFLKTI